VLHLGAEGLERGGERVQRAPGVQGAHEAGRGVPHQPRLGSCTDWKDPLFTLNLQAATHTLVAMVCLAGGSRQATRVLPIGAANSTRSMFTIKQLSSSSLRTHHGQTCGMAGSFAVRGVQVQVVPKVGCRNPIDNRVPCK
jgi:hypothetical protein